MQNQNLLIYSLAQADASNNGPWIDISNLVTVSVQANNYATTKTDIQVSNDPNVMIDNPAGIGAPGSAPTLAQFASTPGSTGNSSMLPNATFFVKTTYITKWGETTASASASLAVTYGNYLYVAPTAPTTAQAPYVTGYNVYVSLTGGVGTYVLQTGPQYQPQRLIDGIGTYGGTINPLGPGQSTHFAISGAIPIAQPGFSMVNGFQQTQWVPPASDQSGGANIGVSVSNGAGVDKLTSDTNQCVAVFIDTANTNWVWAAGNLTWKFLRVVNGSTAPGTTVAWLEGLRG